MSVFSLIVVIQCFAAVVGLVTIVILCQQHASFYQKIATITASCSFVSLLAYLFEVLATNLEEALLAARFGYIGKSYAMVLFLIFIARYCDVNLPKWIVNTLLIFSTVMLLVVLTCPYHKLYYTSVEFVTEGVFPHLVLGKGVLYYVFMTVILLVMLVFMAISVTTLFKRKGEERRRLILLNLSGLLPAIGLILNLSPFMKGFDPTPMGILAACCLATYNILKHGLLDTMQLAGENVMDVTDAGLIVVSKAKKFVYANNKAYEIFPELKNTSETKDILEVLFEDINEGKTNKKTFNRNNVIYELNYSVLKENQQKTELSNNGFMAWVFDKTNDYNYTRDLERLKIKAEEANKSKSMFLAKMSHEIRTPMNGIVGFADLALEKKCDSEITEYLHYIKDSAYSLLRIINDVLDISKIESGKMEIIDLEYNPIRLFEEIENLISAQAKAKGLGFYMFLPEDMPDILVGDNIRIKEVLINILGNAVKYTNQGKITLTVDIIKREDETLTFEIHVKDTGIGIKPENIQGIFNTFEQVNDINNYYVEGTGLGLSIAKQLVELMNGDINVESQYGSGSDFCITIPQRYVLYKKENNDSSYGREKIVIIAKDLKALIVDDNVINLKVEKGILEKYHMAVDVCASGEACLEKLSQDKYDIIFMDHMMPDMDGVETMRAIRKSDNINANAPIILVTANAIVGVKQEMLDLGFEGFVSKPIDVKELEKELLRILPGEKIDILVTVDEEDNTWDESNNTQNEMSEMFQESLMQAGIDVETAINYCGDMETYKDVLRIAVDGSKDKMTAIKKYLANDDIENYRIVVHSLKSGAANIGALKLSEMAKSLEYAAKDNDIEFVHDYTGRMLDMYEEIIEVIRRGIENNSDIVKKECLVSEGRIPIEEWESKIKAVEFLIDELETEEAAEIIEEIMSYELNQEIKEILLEMKESLGKFDIETAKEGMLSLKGIDID